MRQDGPERGRWTTRRLLALAAIVAIVAVFVGLTLWMASVAAGHLGG